MYAGYREVKEQPVVSFNRKERVASEGASTTLANSIISALREAGLPVHPFSPVRTHVIRAGREWVPAILRYNRVPNRVLVELANLGNEEDRALMKTRGFRGALADSLASAVVAFFGGPPPGIYGPVPPPASRVSRAAPKQVKPAPKKSRKKR